ncbi:MAG: hypothetical protein ABEJ78_12725 [Haloferacaceae archaeon]|uniref:hypothetical protein n=1 Tax=Salinirarus marinus TaxID=3068310 RepID=UPI0035EE6601
MSKVTCTDCSRKIAMHELEAKTTAVSGGFSTRYRCPFCHTEMDDVASQLTR